MIWEMGHTSGFIAVLQSQVPYLSVPLRGFVFGKGEMEDFNVRSTTASMAKSSQPWRITK
jgi:hypothetical protein